MKASKKRIEVAYEDGQRVAATTTLTANEDKNPAAEQEKTMQEQLTVPGDDLLANLGLDLAGELQEDGTAEDTEEEDLFPNDPDPDAEAVKAASAPQPKQTEKVVGMVLNGVFYPGMRPAQSQGTHLPPRQVLYPMGPVPTMPPVVGPFPAARGPQFGQAPFGFFAHQPQPHAVAQQPAAHFGATPF